MTRIALAALAFAGLATAAPAQQAGPIYATQAEIAAAQAKAAASVKPGHGSANTPLMALGGYTAKVEYHVGPNIANAHPVQAEMFHALEGGGTLVTGGTIVGTGLGSRIEGGTERHIGAGDVFIVPEGMPHWFPRVDGHLVLISVMLPRPAVPPAR